jgi:Schlafen group 3, DNA/RNA helicase domain
MPGPVLQRYFYSDAVASFLNRDTDRILGTLAKNNTFALDATQRDAWLDEIRVLKATLAELGRDGFLYLEFSIPRLGKRVDAILLLGPIVFVIEFKVGESTFPASALDQVWDYAIDLKNFHETSHDCVLAPILVATNAKDCPPVIAEPEHGDRVLKPITCNSRTLGDAINAVLAKFGGTAIDAQHWQTGRYSPTPTIIEAATALYNGHSVAEISRHDAGAINLTSTTDALEEILRWARAKSRKAICFVTGVPGAGKTLVGLNVATRHIDKDEGLHSVFLSGNGPLVAILREALARDKVRHEKERGRKVKKGETLSEVKMFIQNVHHFRDECLVDADRPPIEHVAIFDEAQRAWNRQQTANFMLRKKQRPNFDRSEPEFLISCLDRHPDWGVVVCLVGGGQEINTGEAGISEWIDSVLRSFPDWHLFISSRLTDSEYAAGEAITKVRQYPRVEFRDELHLSVSMRSFRAENVSAFVKDLLDLDTARARQHHAQLRDRYPIVITRDLQRAKRWLRQQARGNERYGIVVSSQAQRLKPHGIDVRPKVNPIHWFLDGKADVRSSYYLEDVATEFHVQGLELDWTCVTWDADFRHTDTGWSHWSFIGTRWNRIRKPERQDYLKNAYRVLLTRARQGMVIVVPEGEPADPTRRAGFYDGTFEYLRGVGMALI